MIASGSSLERVIRCRASAVLPRAWKESSDYADRGTAIHGHLERVAEGMAPAASLAKVPAEHREACAAVDLDALAGDLRLSAEVALAYSPLTDTARMLGQGLARDYSAIGPDEIPMTIDLAGLAGAIGIARDYKTGWKRLPPAADNWQIRGCALAVARAFDVDEVDAQLIYLRDGEVARRDRATFDAFQLLAFAAELRRAWDRALADRAAYARGEHVEPTAGPWCNYCPSAHACPAKVGLIKAAINGEIVRSDDVAALWPRVNDAIKLLGALKSEMMAVAAREPIRLAVAEDGAETWLGEVVGEGNEKLDAAIAIDVAATVLSVPPEEAAAFQREVCSMDVTKAAIEAAVKARAPRGKGAAAMRTILHGIRQRNGASRPTRRAVEVYTVKAADAAKEST